MRTILKTRGFTIIELLVTVAVFLIIFGALFTAVQFTIRLIGLSKITTSALALANDRIEYIRSLSYDNVGTVGGIPNGTIPQNATTTLNGILFFERVLVEYVDSPDDGIGASDTNGIVADYKQVKVEYSWMGRSGTSTIFLLTNMTPPGIETTGGGGTLTVNVFDALVQPVSGAAVNVYNNTTTTTINTTRYTNASGVAMFSGAPVAANYQITVTKAGFSTDKTYVATTSNPNPITSPVAVLAGAVSTMNFQIDRLSSLTIRTLALPTTGMFSDTLNNVTLIATSTNVVSISGDLVLSGGSGAYAPLGSVYATATAPSTLIGWQTATWNAGIPASTSLAVHLYSVSGTGFYTLIPDSVLAGNSTGFATGPINITGISSTTYPSLALGATLTSSKNTVTPALNDWSITYVTAQPTIGSIPVTFTSSKIIGTQVDTTPIYKYSNTFTTSGSGDLTISDREWDSYKVALGPGAYDIAEACADIPFVLNPGVNDLLKLTLAPSQPYTVRISVVDTNNVPIPYTDVTISRVGFSDTIMTSPCGQAFFNTGLGAHTDYDVTVQKTGYVTQTISAYEINGDEVLKVNLVAS